MLVVSAETLKRLPAIFDLADFRHVGHRAARIQVRQNDILAVATKHVRTLRHKVHAAEDDILSFCFGGNLREFVRIAGVVGEADDLVALVMVAQQNRGFAETRTCRGNALVHGVVGKGEVVIKRALFACRHLNRWDCNVLN